MGADKLNAGSDLLASHPGGSRDIIVASCYRNQEKAPLRPLGSYADLSFFTSSGPFFVTLMVGCIYPLLPFLCSSTIGEFCDEQSPG